MRTIFRIIFNGSPAYFIWVIFLLACIIQGLLAYAGQFTEGLIVTHMRDSVSWGFYIGNFTFLVGVAASAVMLVIPAYVYNWKPIKEVVIFGELLAVSAIIMCLLFVLVDMGHPERLWHMIPFIGRLNFPSSLLAWDALVLNAYLAVNTFVVVYLLWSAYKGEHYNTRIVIPLVILSIPLAVGIHTVTAFLYNGMASRPYWNSAILAPRFLASALCSGPAVLLILFQVLRRITSFEIKDDAIHKVAELMAYAMGFNLFLFGAEIFKEYYSNTHHVVHYEYLFFGLHGEPSPIAWYAWTSLVFSVVAFLLFVVPATRRNFFTMNLGAVMIYFSVYIEKGIALIIPGYTPDTLGQIYAYTPSITEIRVAAGIFGIGFLIFTLLVRIGIFLLFEKDNLVREDSALENKVGVVRPGEDQL
ncbi:polysulfide reductase NrfD [Puniceicoccales bacterium CK1056]|uniref:Polysulfide reductase NrfD n=1 Tax=Oceanipulchritudo coccoides TaxID=2706888 RepID=A0A6B2M5X8_9BACT|nr:NrfD/PsrC family molybdoenzyme membrane anchor subunit [Oceanipulchritudo coccoides]NDV63547.1 polysulfide reductase NrfD [Oceanipulchritudo coccoides]